MKKIVFALQVFGLIALAPVCVSMEINHGAKPLPAKEATIVIAENIKTTSVDLSGSITKFPIAALAFSQADLTTKKKSGKTCCSCRNCKCGSNCTCKDL